MTPKRVLIVSYYWPPSGGGGVQRWLKFAKLLPEHGWEPIVVTPDNPDVPVEDQSLLHDVGDDMAVWRFPVWEPSRFLKNIGFGGASSRLGAESGQHAKTPWSKRLISWVRARAFVPDARIGWVKPTSRAILERLREQPVDLVVTTGPPHSMHLIGLRIKKATDLPWIADFRDPWSTMDYLDDFGLPQRTRLRIRRMEHEVVSTADAVVVTSKGALRALGVGGQKGFVIPNGWDRDDFPSPKEIEIDKPREGGKVIGHFGALYGARNPQDLWDVLDGITPAWRVVLAGPVSADVRSKIDHANLHVTWLGDLPHKEAVRAMHGCDVLLVTHNQSESAKDSTPGKFFEGLATGLPMLAMGPSPSDLQALCEDTGVAFVAHGDPEAQRTLRGLLGNWGVTSSTFPSGKDVAKKYERRFLTSELVGLFKETCNQH